MNKALLPVSWLFGMIIILRNRAFDWGLLKSATVRVPVVSVGNLTVGGTGKTPLVESIVRHLLSAGFRPAIISRGYQRHSKGVVIVSDGRSLCVDAREGGDEPVQMALKFPSVVVVVGERRVEAARTAVQELGANVIVLDDAFQHRYLKRDLDIVVLDSRTNIADEPMLPAGRRREPCSSLKRAQFLVLSRVNGVNRVWTDTLRSWYRGPTALIRNRTESIHRAADHSQVGMEELKGRPALAFSGIGDHEIFVSDLKNLGVAVNRSMRYRDHHTYTTADARELMAMMRRENIDFCVTTEKDIMRLMADAEIRKEFLEAVPVYYTRIAAEIVQGEDFLWSSVDASVGKGGM